MQHFKRRNKHTNSLNGKKSLSFVKLTLITILFFACSSSLFALSPGDTILYPGLGLGVSTGNADTWSGHDVGFVNSNINGWKDAKTDYYSIAFSFGTGFDYLITDSLAITTGLSFDYLPYKIVWQKRDPLVSDIKLDIEFAYITIPIGIRYYFSYFIVGGGIYYAFNIMSDIKLKEPMGDEKHNLDAGNVFGFFIDLGLNFNVLEKNNFLVFVKYRQDLNAAYDDTGFHVTKIEMKALTLNLAYGIKL